MNICPMPMSTVYRDIPTPTKSDCCNCPIFYGENACTQWPQIIDSFMEIPVIPRAIVIRII